MTDKTRYFDWAATALADEDILRDALEASLEKGANPSSVHGAGLDARHALEDARKRCGKVLGVKPETLVFTSGGTESDQIPVLALLQRPQKGSILVSSIEHPAVSAQVDMMRSCGWKVIQVPCGRDGIVTPENVIQRMEDDTALVCVMAVNNETGAIQPVYEIADAIKKHSAGKRRPKLHVDAVQAAGKIPFSFSYPGIDTVAVSAHKICGPRGIGLLYMKDRFEPFLKGGGQEGGIRSGTENLFGALALAACLERYYITPGSEAENLLAREKARTARFIGNLRSLSCCTILPEDREPDDDRFAPGVVQASFANVPGEVMVRALGEKGFYISTGSACSARKNHRPILAAMGVKGEVAAQAVRFSFSCHSTDEGTDTLFAAVKEVAELFNR